MGTPLTRMIKFKLRNCFSQTHQILRICKYQEKIKFEAPKSVVPQLGPSKFSTNQARHMKLPE